MELRSINSDVMYFDDIAAFSTVRTSYKSNALASVTGVSASVQSSVN